MSKPECPTCGSARNCDLCRRCRRIAIENHLVFWVPVTATLLVILQPWRWFG